MNTSLLKSFATSARTELLREVRARITAVLARGSAERVEQPSAVAALERAIVLAGDSAGGVAHVADRVAYTWFNRIVALRFMDAHGYTGIGIVSPAADQVGQPEVLAAAKRGRIDGEVVGEADAGAIAGLLSGSRRARPGVDAQAEAYALLLKHYCHYWHLAMPFMFEPAGDYTELLIPANLLAEDSVLNRSVRVLTEEVCQDVEVIGWLYQFYISERKDEVFAGFRRGAKAGSEEIPAATQLFTPHWIVRYLVENSVGRLWMLNHPESRLVDRMDYYIAPVDEETDFLEVETPEALTIMDPACGSGHMLTYAFDLLSLIYEEEGYAPSQIPSLILTNNLYGTEIDPRAGALAAFALTMKAAAKRKLFLKNPVKPHIRVLGPISFSADELGYLVTDDGDHRAEAAFWNAFTHADTFGSLIRPESALTARLPEHLATLADGGDLFRADALDGARQVIDHATYLGRHYAVVIANPPYMGSKQMNALLSQFMKDEYPTAKADLFAGFIARCTDLVGSRGMVAMITMQSWMFLSSYKRLRAEMLTNQRITSMLHLGARAFDSIGGEVVSATAFILANLPRHAQTDGDRRAGTFIRLVDGDSEADKIAELRVALRDRSARAGFFTASDADFSSIPGSPIVYWLSEKMRGVWLAGAPLSTISEPRQGLITGDGESFVRHWWESSASQTSFAADSRLAAKASRARWFPYNKGGEYRKWYGNHEYVVNWEDDGRAVRSLGTESGGRARSRPQNVDYYFKPTVSWSNVSSGSPAFRIFPRGFIAAGSTGDGVYPSDEDTSMSLLGILNSSVAEAILAATSPTLTFNVGTIASLPVAQADSYRAVLGVARMLVAQSEDDWNLNETSWNFGGNRLVEAFGRNT